MVLALSTTLRLSSGEMCPVASTASYSFIVMTSNIGAKALTDAGAKLSVKDDKLVVTK